jgi:hypothetical protein
VMDLLRRGRTDGPAKEHHGMNTIGEGGGTRVEVTTIMEVPLIRQGGREERARSVNDTLVGVRVA